MGFTNTQYTDAVKSMVGTNINILQNPLYIFNDKKPTIVTYYNKSINNSTLDEVSGLEYATIGENCPSKFNKIEDALLYGIDIININYTLDDEDGQVDTDDITGEAYILPNTFEPQVGDYFVIDHIKKEKLLFIVTEIQSDTLDNGNNFWKIGYKLEHVGQDYLDFLDGINLNDSFKMITSTVGTNLKSVIRSDDYDLLKELEDEAATLKEYFKEIFFNPPIQTFVYVYKDAHFYDPYMIEFMIRNKILDGIDDYIHVDHAMSTWATFGIDYDHTFYKALEDKSKKKADKCSTMAVGSFIEDKLSLLTTRLEDYYFIDYNNPKYAPFMTKIETISNKMIDKIVNGTPFDITVPAFCNIIVNYFDDQEITHKDLELLEDIELNEPKDLFYYMPILIFVLEQYAMKLVSNPE